MLVSARVPWPRRSLVLNDLDMARPVDPSHLFTGRIVLVIPHMDDEVLACGGLIARLPSKHRIQLIYATDGMRSPTPVVPGRDTSTPDLGEVRITESVAAMRVLGVPRDNLHFLRLPEAELGRHRATLEGHLRYLLATLRPDHIFIPFRYDRHPDHLVVNHVLTRGLAMGWVTAQLVEYFVYYRWRLLPRRDIRRYIAPEHLLKVEISDVAKQKRTALDCFHSQTTRYYPWQTRPILTAKLLDEECQHPEIYLPYQPGEPGAAIFSRAVPWIRLVHRLEPVLQKWKYIGSSLWKRSLGRSARDADAT
jgi:N-acetylglucosamine malate deacetylase 1